jgi:3D (Asp-Asp-Asp) domain-containing protein
LMADGSNTRSRSVANNFLPFGTKIKTNKPGPRGLRIFYVRDRIGFGSELDFWTDSCSDANQWGRRQITFRVLRYGR